MEGLRSGTFDVLVGVNLLREGLDLPEVSLVAILDADKEGFLRSERSLTQTAGRAARNLNGKVVMYANTMTDSMRRTIEETNRRREKQLAYNEMNNITPQQIVKAASNILNDIRKKTGEKQVYVEPQKIDIAADPVVQYMSREALEKAMETAKKSMEKAASELNFIEAARYRDEMLAYRNILSEKLKVKVKRNEMNEKSENNSLNLRKIYFMGKVSDISRGNFVRYNGELSMVLEYEHRTPGNLRAFYQVKMRNLKSGRLIEQRFRPDDDMEIVRVHFKEQQFLYIDGGNVVCMDTETFDQIHVPKETIGAGIDLLKEGANIKVYFDGEEPVFAELPVSVEMEVTYTEPGMKGDTATRTLKTATIETGGQVKVPLFINIGDRIKIDTRTGDYIERCK